MKGVNSYHKPDVSMSMKNEYKVIATVTLSKNNQLKFKEEIEYKSSVLNVFLNSNSSDSLEIIIEAKSDDKLPFEHLAKNEVSRILNILSWEYSLYISKYNFSDIHVKEIGSDTQISATENICISEAINILKEVEGGEIKRKLNNNYDDEINEILLMWREATSQESDGLKHFLLFRILEKLNGENRANADEWIKDKYPHVEKETGYHGEEISIYTFLRDNVHAKTADFPFAKIDENISQFQGIVYRAIKDHIDSN